MRLLLVLPCILVGCLPTKSQVVQCNTDPECGPGWHCETQSHLCVCSGASVPGCHGFGDALPVAPDASADAIVASIFDATIAPTDGWVDAASGDGGRCGGRRCCGRCCGGCSVASLQGER